MKILMTCEWYYPRIGGVERVMQVIAESLVQRDVEVVVATSQTEPKISNHNGVEIEHFSISGNSARGIVGSRSEIKRYQNLLLDHNFDVVFQYACQSWHTDLALPILANIKAKKILAPCGFSGLIGVLRRIIYWQYFRTLKKNLHKYDGFVVHSHRYQDAEFLKENGAKNISCIPNGVFPKEFKKWNKAEARKFLGIPPDKFGVLNVSNHYKIKGHDKICRGFLQANLKNAHLMIVGCKPQGGSGCYDACQKVADNYPNISLIDGTGRDRVLAAYAAADVFVLASEVECYPLVVLEAMAAGLPVLSTKVGAVEDMIAGKFFSTEAELARLLYMVQEEMSDCSSSQLEGHFDWATISARYYDLFYRLSSN